MTNHLARRFGHVVYGVTNAATMTNDITLAASRNAGWIFVTDDTNTANPYEQLPVYWTNEVNTIRAWNLAQPATQLKLLPAGNGASRLQITGAPGVYELQTSSNLTDWSALAIAGTASNTLSVTDTNAAGRPQRFYRTRQ